MSHERLTDQVHEMVRSLAAADLPFDNSDNFREALGLDSLDAVELILMIELDFGIDVSDSQAERMFTVNDIVAFLEQQGVQ